MVTFKAGDICWHVRHGKVTLKSAGDNYPDNLVRHNTELILKCGKASHHDVGRVLYTLEEAERFGWHKPEPRVVEFECPVHDAAGGAEGKICRHELADFIGKRVKVRVDELP